MCWIKVRAVCLLWRSGRIRFHIIDALVYGMGLRDGGEWGYWPLHGGLGYVHTSIRTCIHAYVAHVLLCRKERRREAKVHACMHE